jgi:REP element-mobilizing transposase RayT
MPDKFKNKYRISSTRLSNWDYSSNGSYFITTCTARRYHYFGEIVNEEMQFSEIGSCANKCWLAIPDHFPWVYLDEFIVMPNHMHGIITIEKPFIYNSAGFPVETGHALSLPENVKPQHPRFRNQGQNTISAMVGSFKSAVTKYYNENALHFKWQSRFHDHIIRDKNEFFRIRNYIWNNPRNWGKDKFFGEKRYAE